MEAPAARQRRREPRERGLEGSMGAERATREGRPLHDRSSPPIALHPDPTLRPLEARASLGTRRNRGGAEDAEFREQKEAIQSSSSSGLRVLRASAVPLESSLSRPRPGSRRSPPDGSCASPGLA